MTRTEIDARRRREQDILDRLENVKRLIQMEYTLLTVDGAHLYCHYHPKNFEGKSYGEDLLHDLRDEIQLQLLSITALCYGSNPDISEPVPMLEWNTCDGRNLYDEFRDKWDECLSWNG